MKKLLIAVIAMLILAVPAYAGDTYSVQDAMKQCGLNASEKTQIKYLVESNKDSYNQTVSSLNEGTNSSSFTFDYDNTIKSVSIENPALVTTYKKQGNLKGNFSDKYLGCDLPVLIDGKCRAEIVFKSKDGNYSDDGASQVPSTVNDFYNIKVNEQLFEAAGIKEANSIRFVYTGRYNIDLVYADTPNGEYAIPYDSTGKCGLTNGKVYKVSDIIDAISKNSGIDENELVNNSGLIGELSGNSNTKVGGVKPFIIVSIVSGAVLLLIIVFLLIRKLKKARPNTL